MSELSIFDIYEEYKKNPHSNKDSYCAKEGELHFLLSPNPDTEIAIHRIYLKEKYQRTGILTRLIEMMIDDKYQTIAICGMNENTTAFIAQFEYQGKFFYRPYKIENYRTSA